jgi:hypothetical protein
LWLCSCFGVFVRRHNLVVCCDKRCFFPPM